MFGGNFPQRRDSSRRNFAEALGACRAGAIVLAFCGVMLWISPGFFFKDDIQLGLGGVDEIVRAWSHGEYPLLNPCSWVSGNLAGEYGAGTFSIFFNLCVVLLWKLPLSLASRSAALSMTYLFVMAAGSYLLARQRGLRTSVSTIVALAACLNGWMIGWGATDWLGALFGCAWLPWVWWALDFALRKNGPRLRWMLPCIFVYLLMSGGWPFAVLMLGLLLSWFAVRTICKTRRIAEAWPIVVSGLCGVGLSAPSWLMLMEHMSGSGRATVGMKMQPEWTVPIPSLLGLIVPNFVTPWRVFSIEVPHMSLEMACGLVPATALLGALIFLRGDFVRKFRWELFLLVIVFAIAASPSAGAFRWSFRWLPMVHLVLAIVGAEAFEELWMRSGKISPGHLATNPGYWSALVATVGWTLSLLLRPHGFASGYAVGIELISICLAWGLVESFSSQNLLCEWMPVGAVFVIFVSTYFHIPTTQAVPVYNLSDNQKETGPLDPNRLYFSIYRRPEIYYTTKTTPPGFGALVRPGACSMYAGLRFINGYSPVVPRGIAQIIKSYGHGEPDLATSKKFVENEMDRGGAFWLLGVDGIVIARELNDIIALAARKWQPVYSSDEAVVFHRPGPLTPRVRSLALPDSNGAAFFPARLEHIDDGRNQVTVDVDAPCDTLIVFSRPWFSGYRASLNDRSYDVQRFCGTVPAVKIPAGSKGRLTLLYRPRSLVIGVSIALATALSMGLAAVLVRKRRVAAPVARTAYPPFVDVTDLESV